MNNEQILFNSYIDEVNNLRNAYKIRIEYICKHYPNLMNNCNLDLRSEFQKEVDKRMVILKQYLK